MNKLIKYFSIGLFAVFCIVAQVPIQANPVEFEFTIDELAAIGKWKNKTVDDLIQDAIKGDAAALHSLGMCYLMGCYGLSIDTESANSFFSKSASLGFAPALDKLRAKYQFDDMNCFLLLVYANLVASCGHAEYVVSYHELRNSLVEDVGNDRIAKEIERIAALKKAKILNNLKKLEEANGSPNFTYDYLIYNDITSEDIEYDLKYWAQFVKQNTQ